MGQPLFFIGNPMYQQFNHQSQASYLDIKRYTVCVDVPSKDELLNLISLKNPIITLNTGVALCSLKDNFSKKIGRSISSSRKQSVAFYAFSINIDNDKRLDSRVVVIRLRASLPKMKIAKSTKIEEIILTIKIVDSLKRPMLTNSAII
jgi:hypothetical protein